MRSLEIPDILLDDEIDCDPAHEIAPRAYWMVIFQYCRVLVSPCHVHTRRTFGMNVVELASWSAVDIIQDAVLPSSTSSFF